MAVVPSIKAANSSDRKSARSSSPEPSFPSGHQCYHQTFSPQRLVSRVYSIAEKRLWEQRILGYLLAGTFSRVRVWEAQPGERRFASDVASRREAQRPGGRRQVRSALTRYGLFQFSAQILE